jgi:cytochrome c oxidase assembly factor CtaG
MGRNLDCLTISKAAKSNAEGLAQNMGKFVEAARKRPEIGGIIPAFSVAVPQVFVNVAFVTLWLRRIRNRPHLRTRNKRRNRHWPPRFADSLESPHKGSNDIATLSRSAG